MKVSILDLHCLNALADDYETIASIVDDVRRSSPGNVDADNVATCMTDLVREGLVDAYRLDPATSTYVRIVALPDRLDDAWFRINDRGRQQLDASWVDE